MIRMWRNIDEGGLISWAKWFALISTITLIMWSAAGLIDEVKAQQVPCYFIFGDSLVDNGNNNALASLARANYAPYGIDFPQGPTGRFSNGFTTIDVISQLLGFDDLIPPFAGANSQTLLSGVNFASAAAGIRDETGQQLGARITFNGQIQNYRSAVSTIVNVLGDEDSAANHLSQCIFSLGLGGNDYLNNYFMPTFYNTGTQYTPEDYAESLVQDYSKQLATLYNYGARKVALIAVGPVGCSPSELSQYSSDGVTCVERINSAVRIFNSKLISLVDRFNSNFEGAHFTYINAYGVFEDIIRNPAVYGFRVSNVGCCGVGRNNGQITCLPMQIPCANRRDHLFWDAFHPTEAANLVIGTRAYRAQTTSDAHPYDFETLAKL